MSRKYFSTLNYTLANEDTGLELAILPARLGHILSVAGSGGRVMPLLASAPARITCADLSVAQLYLTELRFESVRALSHQEFLAFWGYPPKSSAAAERKSMFEAMRLTPPARKYLEEQFEGLAWDTLLYAGRWERTFAKLAGINRRVTGPAGLGFFSVLNEDEHFKYWAESFPKRKWALVISLMGNAGVFNALLYKGHFPKKNLPESMFEFYGGAFDRLFKQGPARENFFLQLLFFGRVVFSEGRPVECDPAIFAAVKANLPNCEIEYREGSLLDVGASAKTPVDFVSLSDVPSYFSGATEREFMQRLAPGLAPEAIVVIRDYLRSPENVDLTGFETVTEEHAAAIAREKVQMYRVHIYKHSAITTSTPAAAKNTPRKSRGRP